MLASHRTPLVVAASTCIALSACAASSPAPNGPIPAPTTTAYTTIGPATAAALAKDHWSALPTAPIHFRTNTAAQWDGRQMLVWGGADGQHPYADGASYDPASRLWQVLPPSPLTARYGAASVWTGHDLFIWGGDDGTGGTVHAAAGSAMYDPNTRQWRQLPPSPLPPTVSAQALWIGGEVVVIGGESQTSSDNSYSSAVAAYKPSTNTWRLLPSMATHGQPRVIEELTAAAVGGRMYVWQRWVHVVKQGNSTSGTGGLDAITYDQAEDRWGPLTSASREGPFAAPRALWTGRDFVVAAARECPRSSGCGLSMGLQGYRWDPSIDKWSRLPHGPVDDVGATSLWTGAALLSVGAVGSNNGFGPGEGAAWDPVANAWTALPKAPSGWSTGSDVVWTGDRVLMWGLEFGL